MKREIIASILFLGSVTPTLSQSGDLLVGMGATKCSKAISSEDHRVLARTWLSGFLVGADFLDPSRNGKSVLSNLSPTDIDALLISTCRSGPSENLLSVATDIYVSLRKAAK